MVFERIEKDSGCPYFKAVQKTISEDFKKKINKCLFEYLFYKKLICYKSLKYA